MRASLSRTRRRGPHEHTAESVPGYVVLEPIGHGGFSTVYRARQTGLEREAALKVMAIGPADAAAARRFAREARLTGALSGHPNVVTVFETGTTRTGRPFLAMEYFPAGSLRDLLGRSGPLPVTEVVRIGTAVARALAAAHGAGIVHGDVKPQNVLISQYGEPALADFGLARLLSELEVTSGVDALSPSHAAPEVLEGAEPSELSDVYSLGSMLYELLTGRPAFARDGEGLAAVLRRTIAETPDPLTRDDVPEALAGAVFRAMAKEPGARFASAWEFAEVLTQSTQDGARTASTVPTAVKAPATAPSPSPEPAMTIARPGRVAATAQAASATRRSRKRWYIAAGSTALAGIMAGSLWAGAGTGARGGAPHVLPSTPAPHPSPVEPTVLAAARPSAVTAKDLGTAVELHWTLAPGNTDALLVQVTPAVGGTPMQVVGNGLTSYTVSGLAPETGYCFEVGAVVAFGTPSTVAWSDAVCVRGARPAGGGA